MQRRRRTALVVEDHPEIRSGIRALFQRMGIETVDHPSDGQLVAYAKAYFKRIDHVH